VRCGVARFAKFCFLTVCLLFLPALRAEKVESAALRYFTPAEIRSLSTNASRLIVPTRLEGVVLWVSPKKDRLFLQQDSFLLQVEADLSAHSIAVSDLIVLEGHCLVRDHGTRYTFDSLPVVDNDGLHDIVERSGDIYLAPGRYPFEVGFFNRYEGFSLEVSVQGPQRPKGPIPPELLSHQTRINGETKSEPGLAFRTYEGKWTAMPEFKTLVPKREGAITNFDLSVRPRDEQMGIQYFGDIDLGREGFYTFFTRSDDGSSLSITTPPPSLRVTGQGQIPPSSRISLAKSLSETDTALWVTVQGEVSYAGLGDDGWEIELRSATGRMRVELPSITREIPEFLLHARIRATGIAQGVRTTDGGRVAGELLLPDLTHIGLLSVPPQLWNNLPLTSISRIAALGATTEFVRVRGELQGIDPVAGLFTLAEGANSVRVETIAKLPEKTGLALEVIGRVRRGQTGPSLQWGVFRELDQKNATQKSVPLLTTVEQVHRLSKEDAASHLPVRLQAIVTWSKPGGVDGMVQDGTRGIYVLDLAPSPTDTPRIGDYIEIRGQTDAGDFAPVINATATHIVDRGRIPEPLRPEWEQLLNGSVDCQLVELHGTVTSVHDNIMTMMLPGGSLQVENIPFTPEQTSAYQNAEIHIRGVLTADWDGTSRQVRPGKVIIYTHSIQVDRPAPPDLFDVPTKRVPELLQFDPKATAAERVRISGQIVYGSGTHYRLTEAGAGVRFVTRAPASLAVGDKVEVVGFSHLVGSSPVLLESEVRKLGAAPLPAPMSLQWTNLYQSKFDSTLVELDCALVDHRREGNEEILEVRCGPHVARARMVTHGASLPKLTSGCELRITGVYSMLERQFSSRREGDFEILLGDRSGITILSAPSWWTPRRSLSVFGCLALVLVAALAWVHMLRRRVEVRTYQLRHEVEERKQAESEARRAREEAEVASRAKSQFLATMSHEIRTPMNGVVGMTNLLLETPLAAEQRDYAETVRESAEALLTIINDILDFSKVEAGKVQLDRAAFDLRELVEGSLELIAPQAHGKALELSCVFDPTTPTSVFGDPGRLRQILLNLAANAVKFTGQGEIILTVRPVRVTDSDAEISFELRDTGIGIPTHTLPNLFQPFVQADGSTTRRFGGTGLGLAISRKLVQAMNGEIRVRSEIGVGSTFMFTVRLDRNASARPREFVLSDSARETRIILLDENFSCGPALRTALAACELALDASVTSPEAALALVRDAEHKGKPFRILFAERKQLARLVAMCSDSTLSRLRIIALTRHTDRLKQDDLKKHGFHETLTKPIQLARLGRVLQTVLAPEPAPRVESAHTNNGSREKSALRILLAEDNPVNQKVALKQLEKLGYRAETALDGHEVLRRLEQAEFDLILMDCDMPGLDGYEATRRIRRQEKDQHIQIVAMTANAMQGDREKCLAVGMDNYIPKPTRLSDLQSILDHLSATCRKIENSEPALKP
jgi:signal transduction histidine kinase/CheY-like chemotaxis protein